MDIIMSPESEASIADGLDCVEASSSLRPQAWRGVVFCTGCKDALNDTLNHECLTKGHPDRDCDATTVNCWADHGTCVCEGTCDQSGGGLCAAGKGSFSGVGVDAC